MKQETSTASCVGWLLIAVLLTPVHWVLDGWVLSILWGWFAVPTFGLPALSIPTAIGLRVILGYLTPMPGNHNQKDDKPHGERMAEAVLTVLMKPLIGLFFGWLVKVIWF